MNLALSAVAQAVGGQLQPASAAATLVQSVDIDTRRLLPQSLFVALAGENRDGHDYLPAARAAGAVAALVRQLQDSALPQIVAADTATALWQLARFWRRQVGGQVVAITGSNGKTTVKEMLYGIMTAALDKAQVLRSSGNFNNHLGVPLTLLQLQPKHRLAVLEAGMDHPGELTALSALIAPQVALINNAQRAHIGHFESLAAIARAKGELLSGLPPEGCAVLNADDASFPLWCGLAAGRKIISFGRAKSATLRADFTADGIAINGESISLSVPGEHNKMNALAAAAAATALKLPAAAIARGLAAYRGIDGRLATHCLSDNIMLIDDTYNANPDSTAAALAVLVTAAQARGAQPLLVMGDMLALGDSAAGEHQALVAACRRQSVLLFGVGEHMQEALAGGGGGGVHFSERGELLQRLSVLAKQHDKLCILVKGSRGMQMEDIVAGIRRLFTAAMAGA